MDWAAKPVGQMQRGAAGVKLRVLKMGLGLQKRGVPGPALLFPVLATRTTVMDGNERMRRLEESRLRQDYGHLGRLGIRAIETDSDRSDR